MPRCNQHFIDNVFERWKVKHKDDASASLTLKAITALPEEHRDELSKEFNTSLNLLDSKLVQTRLTVEDHGRHSCLELASDDLSQRVSKVSV